MLDALKSGYNIHVLLELNEQSYWLELELQVSIHLLLAGTVAQSSVSCISNCTPGHMG